MYLCEALNAESLMPKPIAMIAPMLIDPTKIRMIVLANVLEMPTKGSEKANERKTMK